MWYNQRMTYRRIAKIILIFLFVFAGALGIARSALSPEIPEQVFRNNSSSNSSLEDYFKTAQSLSDQNINTVTFTAVGDIMLSREVARKIDKTNDPNLPFRGMESILTSADFNFGNLESPITKDSQYIFESQFTFNAPEEFARGLATYNFKVLSLANNHAADQGPEGLKLTKNILEQWGLYSVGSGASRSEAWTEKIIEMHGVRVGFVAATYGINKGGLKNEQFIALLKENTELENSINRLKTNSDYIVVSMHAGTEYTRTPNKAQIDFAHAAIDAGADMVIGAHPHWIQPIEQYNGKYIFYSLGNFIFDQEWSQETKEGLALQIVLNTTQGSGTGARGDQLQGQPIKASLTSINLIPIIIENYSTPRPANEIETTRILEKINQPDTTLFP